MKFVIGLQPLPLRVGKNKVTSILMCAERYFSLQVISFRVRTSCTETQVINVTASLVSPPLVGSLPAAARSEPPLLLRCLPLTLATPPSERREEGGGMVVVAVAGSFRS